MGLMRTVRVERGDSRYLVSRKRAESSGQRTKNRPGPSSLIYTHLLPRPVCSRKIADPMLAPKQANHPFQA